MGLLSGLKDLGLGKIENAEIYEKKIENPAKKEDVPAKIEQTFDENEVLFDKSCVCPACDNKFTFRAVRTGKARLIGTDNDLRPRYDKFDPIKYDVIVCTKCGYAAVTRFFEKVTQSQAKLIGEQIAGRVRGIKNTGVLSYDDAIARHQVALASAVVKKGAASEKAYTCLKMAWCLRGKRETYQKDAADYDDVIEMCCMDEAEALKGAYEGFVMARESERFPIAGMNEETLDYLIAELAFTNGEFDVSTKLISQLLLKTGVNSRIKDKCRDLKDRIQLEKSKQKGE